MPQELNPDPFRLDANLKEGPIFGAVGREPVSAMGMSAGLETMKSQYKTAGGLVCILDVGRSTQTMMEDMARKHSLPK